MVKIFKSLMILLMFFSCSLFNVQKHTVLNLTIKTYDNFSNEYISTIENDLLFLDEVKLNDFATVITSNISIVDIDENNCSSLQVACVFPDRSKIIFIRPSFFKLNQTERLGTLLHEVAHIKLRNFDHVPCVSPLITNTECDEHADLAFGLELQFYKALDSVRPNTQTKRCIEKTKIRINNLVL